jgi:hypothetical protein
MIPLEVGLTLELHVSVMQTEKGKSIVYTTSSMSAGALSKSPAKTLAGELLGHLAGDSLQFLKEVMVDAAAVTVAVGVPLVTSWEQALEISIGLRPASASGVDTARF